MKENALFSGMALPSGLPENLRRQNPWWEGKPLPVQPSHKRHLVRQIQRCLGSSIAPITVVRGSRQIGKTTAQFHVIEDLLNHGVAPQRIFRAQFDELPSLRKMREPILRLADWFENSILEKSLNQAARDGEVAYFFLDEVQNLEEWAPQLKSLVDSTTVKVVVTGSSALRIEQGRDSLAGRIHSLEVGVLSLTEIAAIRGIGRLEPFLSEEGVRPLQDIEFWKRLHQYGVDNKSIRDISFKAFSERGGYPLVHNLANEDWSILADQLNETIIKRVIQHDLRLGDRGRKRDPELLEELFKLCCRYDGQTPSLSLLAQEVRTALNANIGAQRISTYLRFLADTLLIYLVHPLELRLKRKKGSPKLCLVDHGLRASWLGENIPLDPEALASQPHLTTLAGHIVEGVFGSVASSIQGLDVAHFPERGSEREVDFVLTIGTIRIPVEIKYQRKIDTHRDTVGLRGFIEKTVNNATFGILICQTDESVVQDPRIVTLPLSTFMLLR